MSQRLDARRRERCHAAGNGPAIGSYPKEKVLNKQIERGVDQAAIDIEKVVIFHVICPRVFK